MKREKVLACMLAVLLLPIFTANGYLEGQEHEWLWTQAAGGNGVEVTDIATDNQGNSYLTGHFEGRMTIGNTTFNSRNDQDIFVAKVNAQGQWEWARQAGSSSFRMSDHSYGIAADNDGNVYIAGSFYHRAVFGDIEAQNPIMGHGIFVAKLNSDGDWQWVRVGEGLEITSFYEATGIAVDNSGACYIVGYAGNVRFGQYQLPADWMTVNQFVAKISDAGNWQWARSVSSGRFSGITANQEGNVFLTGTFHEAITLGHTRLEPMGSFDSFVAAINRNGSWLWARQIMGEFDVNTQDISSDLTGNAYVTGNFQGRVFFGNKSKEAARFGSMFVAKIDSDGEWLWVRQPEGAFGIAISTDNDGNSYTTGMRARPSEQSSFGDIDFHSEYRWNVFIAKLNTNGTWQWVRGIVSEEQVGGNSIAADDSGNCYITGSFTGLCFFDDIELTTHYDSALFTASLLVTTTGTSDDGEPTEAPNQTFLGNNYPNPFNPETEIEFTLTADSEVMMTIHNSRGQRVRTLKKGLLRAGEHRVVWNGIDDDGGELSSGIYFYRLKTHDYESVEKMLLIK